MITVEQETLVTYLINFVDLVNFSKVAKSKIAMQFILITHARLYMTLIIQITKFKSHQY